MVVDKGTVNELTVITQTSETEVKEVTVKIDKVTKKIVVTNTEEREVTSGSVQTKPLEPVTIPESQYNSTEITQVIQ